MHRAEILIRNIVGFLGSDLGKAAIALFTGVGCFCWPALVAYPVGAACFYYAIHQFRPVAAWIYEDIRNDLEAS